MEVLTVPLACADPDHDPRSHFSCDNPEATSPNDAVNKLTLSVTGGYSGYAMCNIGRNGTDGFGHPCKDGEYCCFCPEETHNWPPQSTPCNATVGLSNLYERHNGGDSRPCFKDYECYAQRAAQILTEETPGYWYSPLSYGACSLHSSPTANCTWRVKSIEKIVSKQCHANSFFGAVQAAAPTCFASCTSPHVNASDPCWVRCYYQAVLGPDAGKPLGRVGGGLPLGEVLTYWKRPFESDDATRGGCPGLPVPSLEGAEAQAAARASVEEQFERLSRRQQQWRGFT